MESINRPFTASSFERNLAKFQDYIEEITLKYSTDPIEDRRQKILETLRFDQFCDRIRNIFGSDVKGSHLKNIFKKICANPDSDIDWSELFGYDNSDNNVTGANTARSQNNDNYDQIDTNELQVFTVSFKHRIDDTSGSKIKRDVIEALHYSSRLDSFFTASQKGSVTIWNNKLKIQATTQLNEQTDGWITDICYLPNLKRVVIASEKGLTFWSTKQDKKPGNKNTLNIFSVQSINDPPTCIDNIPGESFGEDKIVFGDSCGSLTLIHINAVDLALKSTDDSKKRRILRLENFTKNIYRKKNHESSVLKIKYVRELGSILSCSEDSNDSLVIEEVEKLTKMQSKVKNRSISIERGVSTFCFCSKAHLIACCGFNKAIFLYNPIVLSRPTGRLIGHTFTIIDIVSNEKDQQIISLSSERCFRVWDLSTLQCVQVFNDNERRPGDKRINCMFFDDKRERLLTCSSEFNCWPMTRTVQDTLQLPHTHERPLVAVLYNQTMNQIATVCSESVLKVWESDTGHLIYSLNDIHDKDVSVTCMCLDSSGYRLATAGVNNSIKIWDFGAGQELKYKRGIKHVDQDYCIKNMCYNKSQNDLYLICFGWNNSIKIFLDTNESNDLVFVCNMNDKFTLPNQLLYLTHTRLNVPQSVMSHTIDSSLSHTTSKTPITFESSYDDKCSVFSFHYLNCSTFCEEANLMLTGGDQGEFVCWNLENKDVGKIITLPDYYEATPEFKCSLQDGHSVTPDSAKHLLKINCIRIIIHRTHRFEVILQEEPTLSRQNSKVGSRRSSRINMSRQNTRLSRLKREKSPQIEPQKKHSKALTRSVDFSYEPVIVTGHDDSSIRFWHHDGTFIHEIIPPAAAITGAACVSICQDQDANYIYTGDSRGYVTMWSVGEFIENLQESLISPESLEENKNNLQMVVCWKAHNGPIVDMVYISINKTIATASTDESVRVWWGNRGRFIGFYGQIKPFIIPLDDDSDLTQPYDISEQPIHSKVKARTEKQVLDTNREYPLVVDRNRLILPKISQKTNLSRQATIVQQEGRQKTMAEMLRDKYFKALIKPKHDFDKIDMINASGDRKEGAVFSSLPLYKENKTSKFDVKMLLMENPLRLNKEISYLGMTRYNPNKTKKDLEYQTNKRKFKGNFILPTLKHITTSLSLRSSHSRLKSRSTIRSKV